MKEKNIEVEEETVAQRPLGAFGEPLDVLSPDIAPVERIGWGDAIIACLMGGATWFFSSLWSYPCLHPDVWDAAAVAFGLRPPASPMPGFWTAGAGFLHALFGVSHAEIALQYMGRAFLAVASVCVYAILREWLAFAMRMRPQISRRRTFVARLASIVGAATFVASDPVWACGQCFGETAVVLTFSLGAIESFFLFLRKGTIKYAYIGAIILGILAAESPLGFILPIVFIVVYLFIVNLMPGLISPLFQPEVIEVGKWHATFLYLIAFAAGAAFNGWNFVAAGGLEANGMSAGELPVAYLMGYWKTLLASGSPAAWILWSGICLLPFVVATIRFPPNADEEQFLSYGAGITFLTCGVLAFSQTASVPALWFWTHVSSASPVLLSLGLFCCAATVALSICILGVDSICRNHKMLAEALFGMPDGEGEGDGEDADEDEDEYERRWNVRESRATDILRRVRLVIVPVVIFILLAPGRVKLATRDALESVRDGVVEIVREAGDAKTLITDGTLDAAIELEAARRGKRLVCRSLASSENARDIALRTRDLKDREDLFAFRQETASGLKSWVRDRPSRLNDAAMLTGFDVYGRLGKALPPMSGLVSRPAGFASAAEQAAGVTNAAALADRILGTNRRWRGLFPCSEKRINDAYSALVWRLSRACLYRGEAADGAGDVAAAEAEMERAEALNAKNAHYGELVSKLDARAMSAQKLTPREGLQLAIALGDYAAGREYADVVLSVDPLNPDANFAMAMALVEKGQHARAEVFLKRCLARKPNEPAVYNNLAMAQIARKKFDAAEANVKKALELMPDAPAILATQKLLKDSRKK